MSKSDLLFLGIIATIPIQLGKFFWPDFSYVLGIPIDYRAVSIYLSDFLIIGYLATFFAEHFFLTKQGLQVFQKLNKYRSFLISLLLLNLYLLINAAIAQPPKIASFYFSLRILEFSLLSLFAAITLSAPKAYESVKKVLVLSLFWQSSLIVSQVIFQKSLGFWILGERSFDSTTFGIAHAQFFGSQLLRPYGTFPHPNVAGAYLVIGLLWSLPYWFSQKSSLYIRLAALYFLIATFLTFSKTAILATLAAFITSINKIRYFILGIILFVIVLVLAFRLIPESQIATIAERLVLSQAALDISLKNPLFGVGSTNFILELSKLNLFSIAEVRLLQPVHNVFLLIMAENGIIGLLLFALLLGVALKSADSSHKIALFMAILVYATVDHFFWTLHQGRLLFFLTLAFIIRSK